MTRLWSPYRWTPYLVTSSESPSGTACVNHAADSVARISALHLRLLLLHQDKLGANNLLGVAALPVWQLPAAAVASVPTSDIAAPTSVNTEEAAYNSLLAAQASLPLVTLPLRSVGFLCV